jgi:hypothetical protein
MEAWRGTGDSRVASPIIYKGRRRMALLALRPRTGVKRRAEAATPRPDERRAMGRIEHTLLVGG